MARGVVNDIGSGRLEARGLASDVSKCLVVFCFVATDLGLGTALCRAQVGTYSAKTLGTYLPGTL